MPSRPEPAQADPAAPAASAASAAADKAAGAGSTVGGGAPAPTRIDWIRRPSAGPEDPALATATGVRDATAADAAEGTQPAPAARMAAAVSPSMPAAAPLLVDRADHDRQPLVPVVADPAPPTPTGPATSSHHGAAGRDSGDQSRGAPSGPAALGAPSPTPAPTPPAVTSTSTDAPKTPDVTADPAHLQVAVMVAALRRRSDGTYRMTVQLHPEDLGPVELDVRLRRGTVDLRVHATTDEGHQLLRDHLEDLRGELKRAGLTAGQVDISGGRGQQRPSAGLAPWGEGGRPDRDAAGAGPLVNDDPGEPATLPGTDPDSLDPKTALDVRV